MHVLVPTPNPRQPLLCQDDRRHRSGAIVLVAAPWLRQSLELSERSCHKKPQVRVWFLFKHRFFTCLFLWCLTSLHLESRVRSSRVRRMQNNFVPIHTAKVFIALCPGQVRIDLAQNTSIQWLQSRIFFEGVLVLRPASVISDPFMGCWWNWILEGKHTKIWGHDVWHILSVRLHRLISASCSTPPAVTSHECNTTSKVKLRDSEFLFDHPQTYCVNDTSSTINHFSCEVRGSFSVLPSFHVDLTAKSIWNALQHQAQCFIWRLFLSAASPKSAEIKTKELDCRVQKTRVGSLAN